MKQRIVTREMADYIRSRLIALRVYNTVSGSLDTIRSELKEKFGVSISKNTAHQYSINDFDTVVAQQKRKRGHYQSADSKELKRDFYYIEKTIKCEERNSVRRLVEKMAPDQSKSPQACEERLIKIIKAGGRLSTAKVLDNYYSEHLCKGTERMSERKDAVRNMLESIELKDGLCYEDGEYFFRT